ncbi:MAG TPA: class I adenylate-forming enzyme family protein [Hypericibacter adhaerens]|uniref:class I adenylate-forming enzyme family protein n=1 Tax=Hypericibacter adhaerens TaxID=2602016 RepID=UPI002BA72AD2|nr:class I adenylate-forming enzyme family protein [Hypericibacter adhaerens]HWA43814.1 class I adenylate-forming enzyme family protein [Hypericibacter adhaerens]
MRLEAIGFGSVTDLVSGVTLTGAALRAEAVRRAAILAGHGLGPGQAALITHGGTPGFFCDLFAVWQCGAIAACANPGLTRDELATVAGFLSPKLLLATDGFAHGQGLSLPILDLKREHGAAEAAAPAGLLGGGLDDTALLLFTSGTTGAPKGVAHSYRSILARLALNRAHIGLADLARTLCVLPTHFGHGLIGNCLTPLFAGGDLYLHGAGGLATAAALPQTIDDHAITFMSSVPSFWKIALKAGKPPKGGSLARVHIGSAPLGADLWRQVMGWSGTDRVVNMYGITETANWVAGASAAEGGPEDGLIGRLWGGQAAILTGEGRLLAEGEGEILLQTPSLMQGYWQRPDLTAPVLQAGWFHTGDIGRLDAAGTLRLVGRQKDEINRAGMKINPAEIDLFLERHPQVAEACCFAMADAVSGEILAAAIRTTDNAKLAPADLRAWCLERIRRELVPERWFLLPEIPKTDRGKISRATVRQHCEGLKR